MDFLDIWDLISETFHFLSIKYSATSLKTQFASKSNACRIVVFPEELIPIKTFILSRFKVRSVIPLKPFIVTCLSISSSKADYLFIKLH